MTTPSGHNARSGRFSWIGAALALIAAASPARADAIDGDWCSADGRHLAIQGPRIITPAGNRAAGDYSRHAFAYVAPPASATPASPSPCAC